MKQEEKDEDVEMLPSGGAAASAAPAHTPGQIDVLIQTDYPLAGAGGGVGAQEKNAAAGVDDAPAVHDIGTPIQSHRAPIEDQLKERLRSMEEERTRLQRHIECLEAEKAAGAPDWDQEKSRYAYGGDRPEGR